jgi:hypothetical protein
MIKLHRYLHVVACCDAKKVGVMEVYVEYT